MRLSEKNYFLYKDKSDLPLIREDLIKIGRTLNDERKNIIRAVGEENFNQLESGLKRYELEVAKLEETEVYTQEMEGSLRETGRQLRLQSASMIRLERLSVNQIIYDSRKALFYFFCLALVVAVTTTYFFFSKMFKSLRGIEKTANAICEGNFCKIEGKISKDELGSVVGAINSMCEELGTRHEMLIQSRKLASLGVLTAGVAHEIGNPLNNISMVAQTYVELYDHLKAEDRLEYMQIVLQECERIRKIVQDLLDFSKPKEADFGVVDMNQLIRNSLKLVQNMIAHFRHREQAGVGRRPSSCLHRQKQDRRGVCKPADQCRSRHAVRGNCLDPDETRGGGGLCRNRSGGHRKRHPSRVPAQHL